MLTVKFGFKIQLITRYKKRFENIENNKTMSQLNKGRIWQYRYKKAFLENILPKNKEKFKILSKS